MKPLPRPLNEGELIVRDSQGNIIRRLVAVPGGFREIPRIVSSAELDMQDHIRGRVNPSQKGASYGAPAPAA